MLPAERDRVDENVIMMSVSDDSGVGHGILFVIL